jgi:Raf kinase inhibitor-like YbhB/YbcL family protein
MARCSREAVSTNMRILNSAFLVGLGVCLVAGSVVSARVRANDTSALAMDQVLSPAIQPLYVTSPAVQPGTPLPDVYTAFGKDLSPPVEWDGAPPGVQSYVVIMEDADAHGGRPMLLWLAYDIPATAKGLNKNVRNRGEPKSPLGMAQGVNSAGGIGYIGPHPADGDPPHHYHIEVFALDRVLKLHPGLPLEKVVAAMNDRVLAEGEVVGLFGAPAQKIVAAN